MRITVIGPVIVLLVALASSAAADDAAREAAIEKCVASVVHSRGYASPFAANLFRTSRMWADCDENWDKVCWPRVKESLPDTTALARKVGEINRKYSRLGSPCGIRDLNSETVDKIPLWCGIQRKGCLDEIDKAIAVIEAANEADRCSWQEEFELHQREQCEKQVRDQEAQAVKEAARRQDAERRRADDVERRRTEQARQQAEQRAAEQRAEDARAADQRAEEERVRAEAERQQAVEEAAEASRQAQAALVGTGAALATGLMASADETDPRRRPADQLDLAAGLAIVSMSSDHGCGHADASCTGAGAGLAVGYRHRWWRSRDFGQPQRGVEVGGRIAVSFGLGSPDLTTGRSASLVFFRAPEIWADYWRGPFAVGLYASFQRMSGGDDAGGESAPLELLAGPELSFGASRFDYARLTLRWLPISGGGGSVGCFAGLGELGPMGLYMALHVQRCSIDDLSAVYPAHGEPVSTFQVLIAGGRRFRW